MSLFTLVFVVICLQSVQIKISVEGISIHDDECHWCCMSSFHFDPLFLSTPYSSLKFSLTITIRSNLNRDNINEQTKSLLMTSTSPSSPSSLRPISLYSKHASCDALLLFLCLDGSVMVDTQIWCLHYERWWFLSFLTSFPSTKSTKKVTAAISAPTNLQTIFDVGVGAFLDLFTLISMAYKSTVCESTSFNLFFLPRLLYTTAAASWICFWTRQLS